MLQTIEEEKYYKGSEEHTGTLYTDVKQVNFLNKDNLIVAYLELGVKALEEIEGFGELETFEPLTSNILKYKDSEMKELLDSAGITFNASGNNLLIAEINSVINDLIKDDITKNPNKYFSLDVSKWEVV